MSSTTDPQGNELDPQGASRSLEVTGLGVVVIGRNEGERLRRCLLSLTAMQGAIAYVDSGSTDGSVELAAGLGAQVVELDMALPFTAARARNAGFEALLKALPELRYVQFVDGDCEVVAGWLEAAVAALDSAPDVAVVCGRRRERFPDRSVYNQLCDLEWDTPVGEAEACGGDALMRVDAFQRAKGYNPQLVAGEEPELCVRLRGLGYRVLRLPHEMTLHDADMQRFSQWWKRTVRSGHAFAELAAMHGEGLSGPGVRSTLGNLAYGVALPLALGVATRLTPLAVGGWLAYPALYTRVVRGQLQRGRSPREANLYAAACTVGKLPEALGALRFLYGAATGHRSGIMEYKGVAAR